MDDDSEEERFLKDIESVEGPAKKKKKVKKGGTVKAKRKKKGLGVKPTKNSVGFKHSDLSHIVHHSKILHKKKMVGHPHHHHKHHKKGSKDARNSEDVADDPDLHEGPDEADNPDDQKGPNEPRKDSLPKEDDAKPGGAVRSMFNFFKGITGGNKGATAAQEIPTAPTATANPGDVVINVSDAPEEQRQSEAERGVDDNSLNPKHKPHDLQPKAHSSFRRVTGSLTADDDNDELAVVHDGFSGDEPPPEGNENKEEYRNVWSVEAFEPTKDRRYAKKYSRAFAPYIFLATIFGRFPISYYFTKDGTLVYQFSLKKLPEISFVVQGIWNVLLFFMVIINLFGIMMNFPATPHSKGKLGRLVRSEELIIVKRNIVPLMIFVTNLTHIFIATICILIKRNYIVRYFSYWGEVVELLRLDVADKLRMDMLRQMCVLLGMFFVIIGLHASNKFAVCNGGGAAITISIVRFFFPGSHDYNRFKYVKWFGIIIFAFTYIGGKFYMMYFFYRCRLIKNLLIVWNRRFNICVFGGPGATKRMVRSTRAYLFKDHIVTLNLIEGANYELRWILESYALLNMFTMVFECYHANRAVTGVEFTESRQGDVIPLAIYFLFDFYIFFITYLEGGMIPEQTKVAFDIVKKKGMMLQRADQELWFMLSMRISFAGCAGGQPLGIIGAEFVFISKTFIIIAIGFMVSHLIMIYQFDFPLDQTPFSDPNCKRLDVKSLLARMEGKSYKNACDGDYKWM